jgi:cobyrinic acid a,c-diamide synthase
LKETRHHCWPRLVDSEKAPVIAAHEFHYSALDNLDAEPTYAFEVLRGTGIDGRHDGLVYKNMLAGYTHMRAAGDNDWPRRFVAHVRGCKR